MKNIALLIALVWLCCPVAQAGELTVHIGPPSLGSGGNNPVSIPPLNLGDYEFQYITKGGFETNLAISPGVLLGERSTFSGTGGYVSFGGGAVIDANGAGPGIYSSLGWEGSGSVRFNAEFKQALGFSFSGNTVLSPYAVRLGVSFVF